MEINLLNVIIIILLLGDPCHFLRSSSQALTGSSYLTVAQSQEKAENLVHIGTDKKTAFSILKIQPKFCSV